MTLWHSVGDDDSIDKANNAALNRDSTWRDMHACADQGPRFTWIHMLLPLIVDWQAVYCNKISLISCLLYLISNASWINDLMADLRQSLTTTSWSGIVAETMLTEFLLVTAAPFLCNAAIFDYFGPLSNGPCINSSVGKVPYIFSLWPHMLMATRYDSEIVI